MGWSHHGSLVGSPTNWGRKWHTPTRLFPSGVSRLVMTGSCLMFFVPRTTTKIISRRDLKNMSNGISLSLICNHLQVFTFHCQLFHGLALARLNVGGISVANVTFHGLDQLVSLIAHQGHNSTNTWLISWSDSIGRRSQPSNRAWLVG